MVLHIRQKKRKKQVNMKTVSFKVNPTNISNFIITNSINILITAQSESVLSFSVKDISFGESSSDSNYHKWIFHTQAAFSDMLFCFQMQTVVHPQYFSGSVLLVQALNLL